MFAETVEDMIAAFRSDVDDVASSDGSDNLWDVTDVLRYLNIAVDKTARTTLSLHEVITLAVTAGDPVVALPRRVLHLRHVRLASTGYVLSEQNANEGLFGVDDYGITTSITDELFSGRSGTPRVYVRDYETLGLRLYPTPVVDDSVIAQCTVTIESPLDETDDMPFTDADDQYLTLLWMKKLAYAKHDAETRDMERSKEYEAEYIAFALERNAAVRSLRRRPGNVRMQW
jgi:hypothetical protein